MNYKNILFGLILTLLIFNTSFVYAENKDIRYYYNNLDQEKQTFIDNIESMPSSLQRLIKNDKIKIEIDTNTEKLNIFLEKTKDGSYNISKEEIEKVNVWVSGKEEAINKILEAEDPIAELQAAIKNKDVTIKTKGFFRSIKFKIGQLFLNLKR